MENKEKENKFKLVMKEFKLGKLKSSTGQTVTDKSQAIAIAFSESGLEKALMEENKETKINVEYKFESTVEDENCENCINFISSSSTCNRVEGIISKTGICNLFNSFELKEDTIIKAEENNIEQSYTNNMNLEGSRKDKIEKSLNNLLTRKVFRYNEEEIREDIEKSISTPKQKRYTIKELAVIHNIPIKDMFRELQIGREIEKGNVNGDIDKATQIVVDNLKSNPLYYSNKTK